MGIGFGSSVTKINQEFHMRLILLLLVVFSLSSCGCGSKDPEPKSEPGPTATAEQVEKQLDEEFATGREAKGWLASRDNEFLNLSKESAKEILAKLQDAGAVKVVVLAERIDEKEPAEAALSFMAQVPDGERSRARFFERYNKILDEIGAPLVTDADQKYVYVEPPTSES